MSNVNQFKQDINIIYYSVLFIKNKFRWICYRCFSGNLKAFSIYGVIFRNSYCKKRPWTAVSVLSLLLSLVNLVSCYWHSIVEEWDPVLGLRTPGNHWEPDDRSWEPLNHWEKNVHCNCNFALIFLTKASWYEIWIIIITILSLKLTFT